jgi:hypothetical protein
MGSMSGSTLINHINDYDAIEQPDGSWLHDDGDVYWYNELGEIHREDGPAILRPYMEYRCEDWFFNDEEYSFENWIKLATIPDESKMMLRLQYG